MTRDFIKRLETIDTEGFSAQEVLNRTLMLIKLQDKLRAASFGEWEMPVSQLWGIHIDLPGMVPVLSFASVKDYEDYLARLKQVSAAFEQIEDRMRRGLQDHRVSPLLVTDKVAQQARTIADTSPEQSLFAQPLNSFPASVSVDAQNRLRKAILAEIRSSVIPAYASFARFLTEEYAPKGRTDPGVWALPEGDAYYAFRVRQYTTTDLTPEQIHEMGLQQVAADHAEMLRIAQRLGYKDRRSFEASMRANPELHFKSRQEMLDTFSRFTNAMAGKLPRLFGTLPKAPLAVKPIDKFRENPGILAFYDRPSADGSRPGTLWVNTGGFAQRLKTVESLAYHEGVPGHHVQRALALELSDLPRFRQQLSFTAYVEGWATYSEWLAKEVGAYQDPYYDYGRLQLDLGKAVGLVADTGLHYKHWTRQQTVDYLRDNSAWDEATIQGFTDRFIAWPAQMLAYKVGQLKLLEFRTRAQNELGYAFDLRAFHDTVLSAGALPLDVVENRVNQWIARQKAALNHASGVPRTP